jgi:hypothetical protein
MKTQQGALDLVIQALAWHAVIRSGAFDPTTGVRTLGAVPLVYVDKNPWGRRLDDMTITRNAEEAKAFEDLVHRFRDGTVRLVYSSISFGEGTPRDGSLSASTMALRTVIELHLTGSALTSHDQRADTDATAAFLYRTCNIKGEDAIHGAASLLEGAWYFVTGDDALCRRLNKLYAQWSLPIDALSPVAVVEHLKREVG